MTKEIKLYKFSNGQMLVIALIFLAIVMILASSLFARTAGFLRFGSKSISQEQALNMAEAGIERTLWKLNETAGNCPDCAQEYTVGTTGTFKVTIADKTANLKTITATGYIPNSSNPKNKQTIKVDAYINNQQISFNYATQTGNGGLEMYSNATIKGNAYTNGNISGFSNSLINGEAYAHGTISSPDPTITKLPPHPGSPIENLPTFDAQYWKDQANINNDPYIGDLSYNAGSYDLGPKKIEGNLTLNSNAWLTLHQPIHVTGNFTMNSNTRLYLDPSFGSSGTVVVVDGMIQLNSNAEVFSTLATPKGYIILASTKTSGTGIELNSNSKAGILYALSSDLVMNSNGDVVALAANKLIMNSNAVLNYDEGLASAQFSSGPGGSWQIKKGTYKLTGNP